ncbi:subtilisin-like protein [Myriangium duriaei CBS 260.36]|uniref:Subtilisin-like protein n=1 Tax=Myriangium duriaei CBS 260.36 TaxID=1168546 RepID=A0A9P4JAY5_9PEZI|nr:subtilisin-like protein [Myriangium duriaei CBS 260.36]
MHFLRVVGPALASLFSITQAGVVTQLLDITKVPQEQNAGSRQANAKVNTDHSINVADRYIITFRPNANVPEHMNFVQSLHDKSPGAQATGGKAFEGVTQHYNLSDFHGYAGHFDQSTINKIKSHSDVARTEADQKWSITSTFDQDDAPGYGLGLISHESGRNLHDYLYDQSAGGGTYSYLLDSGINIEHHDLQGRAKLGYNALDPTATVWGDALGHGTHVAGIIGGRTYGVAKRTKLIAVKVVNQGDARLSQVLDGLHWAAAHISSRRRQPNAVIHVSPSGPLSNTWEDALNAASRMGISVVVPAGDDDRDPGRRLRDHRDRGRFANWGPGVDLYAPGVRIQSTWRNDDTRSLSGTAQAAAFVSGLTSYFKGLTDLPDARTTKRHLLRESLRDVVEDPDRERDGAFAFNGARKRDDDRWA